jgi:uncharacterized damage-inducible protein DinB
MTSVPLWFERKFDFSFPANLLPNICVRLRGTPARLEEITRNAARDQLLRKPLEDGKEKWSAQEHVGHLLDLEPLWTARINDFANRGAELTVADLTNRGTTEANHNSKPLDQILAEFRQARMQLLHRVDELDPAHFTHTLLHPRMKTSMRLVDHLYFVAEHDDHHLAHIWEFVQS